LTNNVHCASHWILNYILGPSYASSRFKSAASTLLSFEFTVIARELILYCC